MQSLPARPRAAGQPIPRFRWVSRLALVLALVTVFAAGLLAGRAPQSTGGGAGQTGNDFADQPGYQIVEDTWEIVSEQYVDFENVEQNEIFWRASSGLVDGLGDTGHSRFLDPKEAVEFIAASQGELIGIGVQIRTSGDEIFFPGVIDGGPADEAGVESGDVLLSLDGDDVTRLPLDALDVYLDGVEGSAIQLEIYRPTTGETLTFEIVQRLIEIDPVTWTMLPDGVAMIRLSTFSRDSAAALEETIAESIRAGATGIVFDLRDNGGGFVEEARLVASQFLPENTLIFRERYADGTAKEYVTDGGGLAVDIPLVVLVNRYSASASEIIASALSETGRAEVLGQATFGTGTILYPQQLEDDSLVVIGVGLWETPDGVVVWREGFDPDQEVLLDYGAMPFVPAEDADISFNELIEADDAQVTAALAQLDPKGGGTPEASSSLPATPVSIGQPGAAADGPTIVGGDAMAVEPELAGPTR